MQDHLWSQGRPSLSPSGHIHILSLILQPSKGQIRRLRQPPLPTPEFPTPAVCLSAIQARSSQLASHSLPFSTLNPAPGNPGTAFDDKHSAAYLDIHSAVCEAALGIITLTSGRVPIPLLLVHLPSSLLNHHTEEREKLLNGFLQDPQGTLCRHILPPCAHNRRNQLAFLFSLSYSPHSFSDSPELGWEEAPHAGYCSPFQYQLKHQVCSQRDIGEGQ